VPHRHTVTPSAPTLRPKRPYCHSERSEESEPTANALLPLSYRSVVKAPVPSLRSG